MFYFSLLYLKLQYIEYFILLYYNYSLKLFEKGQKWCTNLGLWFLIWNIKNFTIGILDLILIYGWFLSSIKELSMIIYHAQCALSFVKVYVCTKWRQSLNFRCSVGFFQLLPRCFCCFPNKKIGSNLYIARSQCWCVATLSITSLWFNPTHVHTYYFLYYFSIFYPLLWQKQLSKYWQTEWRLKWFSCPLL